MAGQPSLQSLFLAVIPSVNSVHPELAALSNCALHHEIGAESSRASSREGSLTNPGICPQLLKCVPAAFSYSLPQFTPSTRTLRHVRLRLSFRL